MRTAATSKNGATPPAGPPARPPITRGVRPGPNTPWAQATTGAADPAAAPVTDPDHEWAPLGTWDRSDPDAPPPAAPPAVPILSTGQLDALAGRVVAQLRAGAGRLTGSLRRAPRGTDTLHVPGGRRWAWLYGMALAGIVAALFWLVGQAVTLLSDPLTTLQYGQVRTTHLEVYFGLPGETSVSPSLLTATNDHGVGHIYFLPAGQGAQASVVELPLTDIDPAGKLPLHLAVADVDRDGHPDLLVTVGDSAPAVYLLDTGKLLLRLPTAEEQRRLVLPANGGR